MWPWIKRWLDSKMHDLWPTTYRLGPRPQTLHHSYEKAGLTITDQAIPWNAEAVLVEATVRRLPVNYRKGDFLLHLPHQDPVAAEGLRKDDGDEYHRLTFRLPPLPRSVNAEVRWKDTLLGQLTLPVLSRDEFLQQVRVQMPTMFVRLGEHHQHIACQTFVATQCRGLQASAVITSPTSLVPLMDLGLHVEFRSERSGATQLVPVQLSSTQLAARQALVTVVPRKFPRRIGSWTATWKLGDRPLVTQRVRAISLRAFQRSLRVSDTRFVVQSAKQGVTLQRHVPQLGEHDRVGPCFLVASAEAGMAGLCTLHVSAQVPGAVQPPLLIDQEILISDGPTMFAPGTVEAADLNQVSAFELRLKKHLLGTVSLCPAPTAAFTSEGSFKPPEDFAWTAAAEEELTERLNRLLDSSGNG
jgi:hypothetical protein